MNRRSFFKGAIALVSIGFGGCLDRLQEENDCVVILRGIVLEDVPDEATVVTSNDSRVSDVAYFQDITSEIEKWEKKTEEEKSPYVTKQGVTYPGSVSTFGDADAGGAEAENTYESLPRSTPEGHPEGVYFAHNDTTVVLQTERRCEHE